MPKKNKVTHLILLALLFSCKSQNNRSAYSSETLKIIAISENSFLHVSYLNTDDYGKVACNGLIYMNSGEAAVFDTPSDNTTSEELIDWITNTQKHTITAVVVNHFHKDCLGGLEPFHRQKIPSYANEKTIVLAQKEGNQIPQVGFKGSNELKVGNQIISNRFIGEAHTPDNILSYIPGEALIFGGCMVKSIAAEKGYLGDANETEWSKTMEKIKETYPNLKTVIPGHGDYGGPELLDYTQELFKTK